MAWNYPSVFNSVFNMHRHIYAYLYIGVLFLSKRMNMYPSYIHLYVYVNIHLVFLGSRRNPGTQKRLINSVN